MIEIQLYLHCTEDELGANSCTRFRYLFLWAFLTLSQRLGTLASRKLHEPRERLAHPPRLRPEHH